MLKPTDYLKLYLVLEPSLCGDLEGLLNTTELALKNGVTAVQLRFENDPDKGIWYETAKALKPLLTQYSVPLIINDHIDIALAVDADGVHIGQSDLPVEITRRLIGPNKILGLSVGNREEVLATSTQWVDYIGIGPIFITQTKRDASEALGLEKFQSLLEIKKHPAVAIGGINQKNIADIIALDVEGVSVISAICGQKDVALATKILRDQIDQIQLNLTQHNYLQSTESIKEYSND